MGETCAQGSSSQRNGKIQEDCRKAWKHVIGVGEDTIDARKLGEGAGKFLVNDGAHATPGRFEEFVESDHLNKIMGPEGA